MVLETGGVYNGGVAGLLGTGVKEEGSPEHSGGGGLSKCSGRGSRESGKSSYEWDVIMSEPSNFYC